MFKFIFGTIFAGIFGLLFVGFKELFREVDENPRFVHDLYSMKQK